MILQLPTHILSEKSLILLMASQYSQGFIHVGWCRISEPSTVGIPSMMHFGSGNFKQPKLLEFLLDAKARYLVGKGGQMYGVFLV